MSGWDNTDGWAAKGDEPAKDPVVADFDAADANAADAGAADTGTTDFGGADAGGDDRACRICNETGHLARECPQKPEGFGKCFNCGEEGHNKAECTNPRVFSGKCRHCEKEGHPARDCPDKPAVVCRNCQQEGHMTAECTNNKVFDLTGIAELPIEEAWEELVKTAKEAVETRDLDDFRDAVKVYKKAVGEVTYEELERSFRANDIGIYIIATVPKPGALFDTHTLVNLAGKRDCQFQVGYFLKKAPRTAMLAPLWPKSDAENLERLKNAGVPYERGIPKCLRCKGNFILDGDRLLSNATIVKKKGIVFAIARKPASAALLAAIANSLVTPQPSVRNLVLPKEWSLDTLPRIVPTPPGDRVAVTAGHMAKECDKPKNPANTKCRNCEEMGHFSKDCPKPKDWSKVKCNWDIHPSAALKPTPMAMLQQAIPVMMTVVSALLLVETGKVQMEPTLEPQLLPVDGKILTPLRQPRAALLQVVDAVHAAISSDLKGPDHTVVFKKGSDTFIWRVKLTARCHCTNMFGKSRYLGLVGTKLNVAIGLIAGLDFFFGNGLNTSTVPTWQSECSKSHRRGQLVMVEGALITGGICFSYWLDFGFSFLDPNSIAWRFPVGFQIFFALVILGFVLELPESPRWLVLKGREDEALNVLAALSDLPSDDPYVWEEFQAIKDTVLENQKSGGLRDLITYYAATIYQNEIQLDPLTSRILAACNGTEYFMASWIAVFTIEKFGRRQLMLFGAAGMSFSMVILAIVNYLGGKGPGIVAALFLFIFNTFFAIGWLGMTWLYPAEIVPLRIRAPANAFSTTANWIFNFMGIGSLEIMIQPLSVIHSNAFIFPVVYFFYPETAYRSLEEMDTIFRKCRSVFTVVKIAKEEPRRYGKSGELLIRYEETEEHRQRQASVGAGVGTEKLRREEAEHIDHANPDYRAENGTAKQG
ncbi:MAG: hypothetical protein Q9202_004517 [Teloschistes flavicans]